MRCVTCGYPWKRHDPRTGACVFPSTGSARPGSGGGGQASEPERAIRITLACTGTWRDELSVVEIERTDDAQGHSCLTFLCPACQAPHTSPRVEEC